MNFIFLITNPIKKKIKKKPTIKNNFYENFHKKYLCKIEDLAIINVEKSTQRMVTDSINWYAYQLIDIDIINFDILVVPKVRNGPTEWNGAECSILKYGIYLNTEIVFYRTHTKMQNLYETDTKIRNYFCLITEFFC